MKWHKSGGERKKSRKSRKNPTRIISPFILGLKKGWLGEWRVKERVFILTGQDSFSPGHFPPRDLMLLRNRETGRGLKFKLFGRKYSDLCSRVRLRLHLSS